MFKFRSRSSSGNDLLSSKLFNEETFYDAFRQDLENCLNELLIESPFITTRRLTALLPTLTKLKDRKVRIVINTRDPHEHDDSYMREESQRAVATLQRQGIQVLFTIGHHRKLVIVDRRVLYEGSLNVLSQNNSCEIMRRIESVKLAWQMAHFTGIDNFIS
jgi:phosphatidylserine/phosphatidylglycerophosphate/cardiolipin synthase-like enzyme